MRPIFWKSEYGDRDCRPGQSDTFGAVQKELRQGLSGLLGRDVPAAEAVCQDGAIVVGTYKSSPVVQTLISQTALNALGPEGYVIRSALWENTR